MLLVTKKGSRQLIVDYYSKRRMAGVAIWHYQRYRCIL